MTMSGKTKPKARVNVERTDDTNSKATACLAEMAGTRISNPSPCCNNKAITILILILLIHKTADMSLRSPMETTKNLSSLKTR